MLRLRSVVERAIIEVDSEAYNAIRDMFLSNNYKGIVPDKDINFILSDARWSRLYGKAKLQAAWKELVRDEYVKKIGTDWEWVG